MKRIHFFHDWTDWSQISLRFTDGRGISSSVKDVVGQTRKCIECGFVQIREVFPGRVTSW